MSIPAMPPQNRTAKRLDPAVDGVIDRLREAMREAGMDPDGRDQSKLADLTDGVIDQPQISRLLRRQQLPKLSKLRALAVALRVHPGWLAFGDEPKRLPVGVDSSSNAGMADALELLRRIDRHLAGPGESGSDVLTRSDVDADKPKP